MTQTGNGIAIDATIRACGSSPKIPTGKNAITVKTEDIGDKERVRKTSAVPLFVMDADGDGRLAENGERQKSDCILEHGFLPEE